MAKKIDLALVADTFAGGYFIAYSLNKNSRKIEEAMERTFSRDGTSPNAFESDLDLNGFALYGVLVPYEMRVNAPHGGHLNEPGPDQAK